MFQVCITHICLSPCTTRCTQHTLHQYTTQTHICAHLQWFIMFCEGETVVVPLFNSSLCIFFSLSAPVHSRTTPKIRNTAPILFVTLIWISACGEFTHVHIQRVLKCAVGDAAVWRRVYPHVDSHINVIINGMLVYRLDVYFNLVWSLWLVKIQELSLLLLTLATLHSCSASLSSFHTHCVFSFGILFLIAFTFRIPFIFF